MPKPNPDRRPRNRQATSRAILEAATAAFAESGYDAATTRSVAERAGASEGLIHRYFGGKEGLLLALMRDFLEDSARYPSLSDEDTELHRALEEFLLASFEHHRRTAGGMRVLVSRAIIDPAVGERMGHDIMDCHVTALAARLAQFQRQGKVHDQADLESAAFVLSAFSFVLGFMGAQVFQFTPERLQRVSRWLAAMLAHELQPAPPGKPSPSKRRSP